MLTVKDYDVELMEKSLKISVEDALEEGNKDGIWVQKYWDSDTGDHYWQVSLKRKDFGINMFEEFKKCRLIISTELFFESLENDNFYECVQILTDFIECNWLEKDTIHILTIKYQDEYDMYGVSRKSFAWYGDLYACN